jgi:hypothetical protein
MKLRGLVPNLHIHASVSDLYIPTIGPPNLLHRLIVCHPYFSPSVSLSVGFLKFVYREQGQGCLLKEKSLLS